jgi:hypothetical protein
MKLGKLLLAVVGAAVLLGAFVSSASARNLSNSSLTNRALWTAWHFRGGFGTISCELLLTGSYHARTMTKTVNSLLGYITESRFLRCSSGGLTINTASLPWHRRYRSFSGTLPNITGMEETVTGMEWTLREPTFGITCTVRAAESSTILTYAISSGTVTSSAISGSSPCGSFTGVQEGSTTNVTEGGGARITIRLI